MLADAAALCGWCADFWRDETDHYSNGVRIHYAVDVDVIMMYADAENNRVYGRVFSQADDVSGLVTALVGDFVLQRLVQPFSAADEATTMQSQPLMLIPPHGAELQRVADAISSEEAGLTGDEARRFVDAKDALSVRLHGLSFDAAVEVFLSFLSEHAPKLQNLLFGQSGNAARMAQLNLLPLGRLVGLRGHPAFKGEGCLSPPPLRDAAGRDTSEMLKVADDWYQLMLEGSQQLSPFRRSRVDDDAWVLASLQWANTDAVRRGLKQRLVLITGTPRILDAGKKRKAFHDGFDTFADAYLRDPRAFMGAKQFFAPYKGDGRDTKFRILEWMAVLFPNAIRQQRMQAQLNMDQGSTVQVDANMPDVRAITGGEALNPAVDILLSKGYRQVQGAHFPEDALSEWCDVVRHTHSQVVLQRQQDVRSRVLADLLKGLPDSGGDRFEHLMNCLSKRVQQSFSNLYLTTGVIGVEQLLDSHSSMRGVPALRFDLPEYKDAQGQCDALADQLFKKEGRPKSFDLARMYEQLAKDDDSNYHAHVLHAFVYASCGRWFSARTLCRVALLVVDSLRKADTDRRTGREAAYLMAVAERRLAIDEQKLQLAVSALNEAKRRSRGDEVQDVRFASEELAQVVTRQQLAHFKRDDTSNFNPAPVLERAQRLCEAATSGAEPRAVRRWVVRQSVTNGLLAALMAADAGMYSPQTVGSARKLMAILKSERLAPQLSTSSEQSQLYPDEISDYIWLVSAAKFESQPRAAEARQVLANWALSTRPQSLLPFEQERYRRFMLLAGVDPAITTGRTIDPESGGTVR